MTGLDFRTAAASNDAAAAFFRGHYSVFKICPLATASENTRQAFLTGYYEPEVEGSWTKTSSFSEPIFARPSDLQSFDPGCQPLGPELQAGRRTKEGGLEAYPTRAEINCGALDGRAIPLLWVRDGIEAFMIHVQGSARVIMNDGQRVRLTYAGRNGQPYTSIGKILVADGHIEPCDMTLDRLKEWVRSAGQLPGEAGRLLMERNRSYIFFAANSNLEVTEGPIGAEGVSLTRLHSIAVDRNLWPYGLPFWISGQLPWESAEPSAFHRLMIAQDTGSAITGPARADLFFGTGAANGVLAGQIRHHADMFVLWPRETS